MDSEQRKEYNKKYYETKKDAIKKKLFTKEECPKCNRKVSHQNINKHQKSSYCIARSFGNDKTLESKDDKSVVNASIEMKENIDVLRKKIEELESKLLEK